MSTLQTTGCNFAKTSEFMKGHFWTSEKVDKISYLKLNMLFLTVCASFRQDQLFFAVFYTSVKKFPRSLLRALEILRYCRVNNKRGGRMEQAKVGYLTIYPCNGQTLEYFHHFMLVECGKMLVNV